MTESFAPSDRDPFSADDADLAGAGHGPADAAPSADPRKPLPPRPGQPRNSACPPDFDPVDVASRVNGWTAERQRVFIQTLAECGSVTEACEAAGCTPRSAYRLRLRPGAESFDAAWRRAYETGIHRLTAIAFERAIHGTPRTVRRGRETATEFVPNDRLLMFLLQRYDSMRYGNLSGLLPLDVPDPTARARAELPALVEALAEYPDQPDADFHDYFSELPLREFPEHAGKM